MRWVSRAAAAALLIAALTPLGGCNGLTNISAASAFPRLDALSAKAADQPERYYSGYVGDFIPSDAYGAVYPYVGGLKMMSESWGGRLEAYGFADADGRIICDPVYNFCALVTNGVDSAYIVTRNRLPGGYSDELEYYLNADDIDGAEQQCLVISEDGTYAGHFDEALDYSFRTGHTFEYIAVKKDGKWGAIDYFGNEILPCAYMNPPLYSQGLAAVYDYEEGYDHVFNMIQEGKPYYYADAEGNKALGPFTPGSAEATMWMYENLDDMMFNNDRAKLYDGKLHGFINLSGELVIPATFTSIYTPVPWNDEGYALVCEGEYDPVNDQSKTGPVMTFFLIDKDGNRVFEKDARINSLNMVVDAYTHTDDDWKLTALYDLSGNELPVLGDEYQGNGYFVSNTDNTIVLSGNGIERVFDKFSYLQHVKDDWFIVQDNSGGYRNQLFNAQTGITLPETYGYVYESMGVIMAYKYVNNAYYYGTLDDNMRPVIDVTYDSLAPIGGRFMARQGNYGGLLDAEGNWIIRTTLEANFD